MAVPSHACPCVQCLSVRVGGSDRREKRVGICVGADGAYPPNASESNRPKDSQTQPRNRRPSSCALARCSSRLEAEPLRMPGSDDHPREEMRRRRTASGHFFSKCSEPESIQDPQRRPRHREVLWHRQEIASVFLGSFSFEPTRPGEASPSLASSSVESSARRVIPQHRSPLRTNPSQQVRQHAPVEGD